MNQLIRNIVADYNLGINKERTISEINQALLVSGIYLLFQLTGRMQTQSTSSSLAVTPEEIFSPEMMEREVKGTFTNPFNFEGLNTILQNPDGILITCK